MHCLGSQAIHLEIRGRLSKQQIFREADLTRSQLTRAILWWAHMHKARLQGCILAGTIFKRVDLSRTEGLDQAKQTGPSSIGIDTIYESKGQIRANCEV
jgi:uncharacterized protein YjbI with pentapeptide repeats